MDAVIAALAGLAAVGIPGAWWLVHRSREAAGLLGRLEVQEQVGRPRRKPGGPLLEGLAARFAATPVGARLDRHCATHHPGVPFSDAIAVALVAVLATWLLALLLLGGGPVPLLVAACAPLAVDRFFVKVHGNRAVRIEKQLPEALHLQGNVLRAGQSLGRSLEVLAEQTKAPLKDELQRMLDETRLGRPLDDALERFSARIPSRDVDMWVTAMLVHRQTGGNLAGVIDSSARRVAQRLQLRSEIKAMTAQGRLSGMVVAGAPLVFFVLLSASSRDQMDFLFSTPVGLTVLAVGLAMNLFGMLWIRHALRIRS